MLRKDHHIERVKNDIVEFLCAPWWKCFFLHSTVCCSPWHRFATLDDFYKGPEHLIGIPNPKVREGVEKEHCLRGNATKCFTSSNYNVTTCPATEWEFVVCPKEHGADYPHTPRDKALWKVGNAWKGEHGREVIKLADVLSNAAVQLHVNKAGLIEVEVICLRLYTGAVPWRFLVELSL